MRPDSLRHVVIVSDDNSTQMSAGAFDSFVKGRAGYQDYRLHGAVGLSSGGCVARVGSVYQELAQLSGGMLFHICDADWSALFTQLGQEVADLAKTHSKLSHTPVPASVVVRYNGAEAARGSQWELDTPNRQVVQGALPADGTPIEVCYPYTN